MESHPDDERARLKLATSLERANDLDGARRQLLEVAALYEKQGRDRRAVAAYLNALALEEDAATHIRTADVCLRLDRKRDALAHLHKAEALFDKAVSPHQMRVLRRIVKLAPDDASALLRLGEVSLELGDVELGARCLERAAKLYTRPAPRPPSARASTPAPQRASPSGTRFEPVEETVFSSSAPRSTSPRSVAQASETPSAPERCLSARGEAPTSSGSPSSLGSSTFGGSAPPVENRAAPNSSCMPLYDRGPTTGVGRPPQPPVVVGRRIEEERPSADLSAGLLSPAAVVPIEEEVEWLEVDLRTRAESIDQIARFIEECAPLEGEPTDDLSNLTTFDFHLPWMETPGPSGCS